MKVLTSLFSELVYKNNPYFKTCFLTKTSIKNLLTTSKKFRVQLNIFLSNKSPRLALHHSAVTHGSPCDNQIYQDTSVGSLVEIEHHYFRTTIQFYQQVIPHVFLLFLFLANHWFLGKHFEPIHSDHFWLQSLWPLAIYFSKSPWFSIAQCHQKPNFFSGCSISDALAMIVSIPFSRETRSCWLCVVPVSIIFYNANQVSGTSQVLAWLSLISLSKC